MTRIEPLLSPLQVEEVMGDLPSEIHQIAYHSKKVAPGDLFVCIKGYQVDGHDYLAMAAEKGAVVGIVEEFVKGVDIPQIRVKNSRIALARLGVAYYGHASKDLHVVGITATNGKTSTSFLVDNIFREATYKSGLIGTVMTKYDKVLIPSILTTPESLDLQAYFQDMKEKEVTHVTMEVSSSGLELHRTEGVDFDVVAFNNISREHIDAHGSFEAYYDIKSRLVRGLKKDGFAIVNQDEPLIKALIPEIPGKVITFSVTGSEADLYVKDLDLSTGRASFTAVLKEGSHGLVPCQVSVRLKIAGYHAVMNALSAIGIGLASGLAPEIIRRGLEAYEGVERRFEFIYEDEFVIVDDHFANTGNINVTLATMDFMDYKQLHIVYAIRGSRGVTVNRENAEALVAWSKKLGVDKIIASLSQGHVSKKDEVTEEELAVFEEVLSREELPYQVYPTLPEAVNMGLDEVREGDVLLLAGCQGMDYGGQLALQEILRRHPEKNKEKVLAPLQNRVAGIS